MSLKQQVLGDIKSLKESEGLWFASLPCTRATLLRGKPQTSPASRLVGEVWLWWAGPTRTAEGVWAPGHTLGAYHGSWRAGRCPNMTWAVARE